MSNQKLINDVCKKVAREGNEYHLFDPRFGEGFDPILAKPPEEVISDFFMEQDPLFKQIRAMVEQLKRSS